MEFPVFTSHLAWHRSVTSSPFLVLSFPLFLLVFVFNILGGPEQPVRFYILGIPKTTTSQFIHPIMLVIPLQKEKNHKKTPSLFFPPILNM